MAIKNFNTLELELGINELIVDRGDLIMRLTMFIDHHCSDHSSGNYIDSASGEGLNFPVDVDLSKELQTSLGINEDFKPYDRGEITNSILSLEKLRAVTEDLLNQQKLELKQMDEDPHYFEDDDVEEDDEDI